MKQNGALDSKKVLYNNRKNKLLFSAFFILFASIIVIIYRTYPISLSNDVPSILQIPVVFWIVSFLFLLVWCYIYINNNKPIYLLIGSISFYFVLFCSNLMFVSPYEQTDRISIIISTISDSSNLHQINPMYNDYFEWPIFFLLTKIFLEILNLNINQMITIGFFSFNLIIPIILLYMFNYRGSIDSQYRILPIIFYILLSYLFIVNQYVPQALALILLFLCYALYFKYLQIEIKYRTSILIILLFIYIILIFTHPFLFMFFIIPLLMDRVRLFIRRDKANPQIQNIKTLPNNIFILLMVIYGTGFLYRFMSIQSNLASFITLFGTTNGETWTYINSLFGGGNQTVWVASYYPLLEALHSVTSIALKLIILLIILFFLYTIITNRESKNQFSKFDLSVLVSSLLLYLLGLFSIFLGQRSIQVAATSVVKPFANAIKNESSIIFVMLTLLICVTPILLVSTNLINISRAGETLIEDEEMNSAGMFADNTISNDSYVLMAESIYPVSMYPNGFHRYRNLVEVNDNGLFGEMNYIIESPKFKLQATNYGYYYMITDYDKLSNCIYSNGGTNIILKT